MRSRFRNLFLIVLLCSSACIIAQNPGANPLATTGRPGGSRTPVVPVDNDRYRSSIVKLGGGARDGLLYEPKSLGPKSRVAVLYSDRNFGFDPPAAELASVGYRVLYVSYPPLRPGQVAMPLDGFVETSKGITYLRSLPGVQRVVIEGWGAGASSMTLYADIAEHGAAACQGKDVIYPCKTEDASGLAKPDGLILLDPGLGAGTKVSSIDPAYDASGRRAALDKYVAENGYDARTATASYSAAFRKQYFSTQSALNEQAVQNAIARLKELNKADDATDEPLSVPGVVNVSPGASLHTTDRSILSHTKRTHLLLKADGTRPETILRSIRPTTGPVGEEAIKAAEERSGSPAERGYTLRQFLANDAVRTDKDFALTEDDVVGVNWKSSNLGTPAQAEGVTIPTLVMTNTCFQFVVPSEIITEHLAAKDKTLVGIEGSAHEFTPCEPQYGDTKKRLFNYVGEWLSRPGRF